MDNKLEGIHHITAITKDAQANIDFYCGVLGLRLVKLTVNFDDPGSYHLYYGDDLGRPGTVMTFFVWPGAYFGRVGPPQVTSVAFAVPKDASEFWVERIKEHWVELEPEETRFGERVLGFADPDGIRVEIIASADIEDHASTAGPVAPEYAIQGFHGVTISEEGYEKTAKLLTDVMGFRASGNQGNRFRYRADAGSVVDVLCVPSARLGELGAGVVHHMAFRTPDDAQQIAWRNKLAGLGCNVSPVMDRCYFHSIYYREPGGVLFEIATDTPGFIADEPADQLGSKLMLPPWMESLRSKLERVLPHVTLPEWHPEVVHRGI